LARLSSVKPLNRSIAGYSPEPRHGVLANIELCRSVGTWRDSRRRPLALARQADCLYGGPSRQRSFGNVGPPRPGHHSHDLSIVKGAVPETVAIQDISDGALPSDWRNHPATTRALGDAWLDHPSTALLRVPSVIVPSAWNFLLNPAHSDAAKIAIADVIEAPFDPRLMADDRR
jgi:RES domain